MSVVRTLPFRYCRRQSARRLVRRAIEMAKGDLRASTSRTSRRSLIWRGESATGQSAGAGTGGDPVVRLGSFGAAVKRVATAWLPVSGYGPRKAADSWSALVISLELLEKPETSGPRITYIIMGWIVWTGPVCPVLWNTELADRETATNPQEAPAKKRSRLSSSRLVFLLWERRQWPVLGEGEAIVWARRFRAGSWSCGEFQQQVDPEDHTLETREAVTN